MNSTHLDPKAVIGLYFDFLMTGKFEELGKLLADDIVWHQPGAGSLSGDHKGKENVFGLFGEFMKRSEGSFRILSASHKMQNGNLASAALRFTASADSKSIEMEGIDLMRIENGLIKEVWLFSEG